MVEYNDDLAIIVRYDGTKEQFESVKNSYLGKVVFIYGSKTEVDNQAGLVQAIWVSDAVGGRYLDMANVDTIKDGMIHIAGLAIDGAATTLENGANGINFKGANGISIKFNPSNATDNNGVPYWNIEISGKGVIDAIKGTDKDTESTLTLSGVKKFAQSEATTAKSAVIGTDADTEASDTIKGAKKYADKVKTDLEGTTSDTKDSNTISGAKKYADNAAGDAKDAVYETLFGKNVTVDANAKILPSRLPDVILGQLMYGGIIGDKAANIDGVTANIAINPSSLFEDAFGEDVSKENLTPTTFLAKNYRNVYFIVGNPNPSNLTSRVSFSWNDVDYETGDWFLSDGEKWTKIDNTDAVSSVAELTGVITTGALADKLTTAASGYTDPLAKKSDIKIDSISAKTLVDGAEKTYFSTTGPDTTNKNVSFSAEVKTMSKIETDTSAEGFADARDVYNFLKARLSIKVVNTTNN